MSELTDFLLARIAEDEALATAAVADDQGEDGGMEDSFDLLTGRAQWFGADVLPKYADDLARLIVHTAVPRRVLAECAAKRQIIELHKAWPVLVETQPEFSTAGGDDVNSMTLHMSKQIAWTTEQEYRDRFGVEPPTGPILRVLAAPYADHQDYRAEWAL